MSGTAARRRRSSRSDGESLRFGLSAFQGLVEQRLLVRLGIFGAYEKAPCYRIGHDCIQNRKIALPGIEALGLASDLEHRLGVSSGYCTGHESSAPICLGRPAAGARSGLAEGFLDKLGLGLRIELLANDLSRGKHGKIRNFIAKLLSSLLGFSAQRGLSSCHVFV